MSIALEVKVRELEQRVNSLELTMKAFAIAPKEEPGSFERLMGEIKAIKMRMGKRDS